MGTNISRWSQSQRLNNYSRQGTDLREIIQTAISYKIINRSRVRVSVVLSIKGVLVVEWGELGNMVSRKWEPDASP
jgi:hypothetical protein